MKHTAPMKQCRYCHSLGKGSKVEVWSEDDGFSNAWFSAEILRPPLSTHSPSGRKRKRTATAVVKYDHMLAADDDGGGPLIERIKTCFIRPAPPPDSPPDRPFELYEVVDAFFQDTWWTGFVVKVVDDTYTVAFKRPLDLQEFRRSDLRLHWDWVRSEWVKPDKEDTTGLIYIPGTEVEVNRHNESPCRAWLQAVIIGQVGWTSFLVKYKSSDSGEAGLKLETVDIEQIRPYPPEIQVASFNMLERVDVFQDSYWWAGVVTKLLGGKRYVVTLRHKKKMEFSHSELRPHLEWIDGQWIGHPQDQISGTLDDTKRERPCSSGKQYYKKVLSPCVEKAPYLGDSIMEKENHSSSGGKPVEVIRNGDDKITKQQEVGEMKNQVVISAKKRGRLRKSHESLGSILAGTESQITEQQEVGEMKNQAVISAKKRGRLRKSYESLGSILAGTEKERPCLGNKQVNQKKFSPCAEKSLPYLGSSNIKKENHISTSDKPAEVIPNAADKVIMVEEVGERENQAVIYAKRRGRRRNSYESSGSTLDNTKKERPCLANKQDNQKRFSPRVKKLAYSGNSNVVKENHISSNGKPAEVIANGDDKITKQPDVGETKFQVVMPAKRGEIPQKPLESSASILDETEKERPCLGKKQDCQKEISPIVEKSPYLRSLNVEKQNHNFSSDKAAEVPNGDDKKTKQQEVGEAESQAVISAKKGGRGRKFCKSSGSTLDDTEKERPCSSKKLGIRKELNPCVEKLRYFESLKMAKENHLSYGDKPVEVIQKGYDKVLQLPKQALFGCKSEQEASRITHSWKTKQQQAGETDIQAFISSLKRGRSQKSKFDSEPVKRRRNDPSRSKFKDPLPASKVESTFPKIVDTKNFEANTEDQEVCCNILEDFERVKGPGVENFCQPPTVNEQNGDAETGSKEKGNGEHPEQIVANSQAAAEGEELCVAGGLVAGCTAENSKLPVTTEVILTDTMREDGATLASPTTRIISPDDQALVLHVEETHAPTNAEELGDIMRKDVLTLPFVKSYPLWEIIESMEVFKRLPQNPHFEPLMKCKQVKREGAAIGHMLNFASLVKKISKLQENDSKEDFESIMEELDELEELGFDIKIVRGRVSELLQVKVILESFVDESNGVEIEIRQCSDAKTKIDGVVADIDKELKRLEEKRAVLLSKSVDEVYKEMKLISKASVLNEGISSTRERFRSLVKAPW